MRKEKERKKLLKDLEHLTRYYKEVSTRGKHIKEAYDEQIERIVEALKELGK
ncbi:MAG: hypothetical protein Q4F57_06015 [Weeksellaceae bacterium]|nr:hypothetical protein [Weeksellaceae bacterium]